MQQRILTVFMALSMLLVSTSGCIGLLQSREYMEHLRGDIKVKTQTETTTVEHFFNQAEVNREWNEKFTIDSEVTAIGVYFSTYFGGETVKELFEQLGVLDPREVEVTITDPLGTVQYNATRETSGSSPYVNIEPELDGKFASGEWNINIVGTGGGLFGEQDDFSLSVYVDRSCTIYPQEDVCVVD